MRRLTALLLYLNVALLLVGLAVADALLVERASLDAAMPPEPSVAIEIDKLAGDDIPALLTQLGYATEVRHEPTLLEQVVPAGTPVTYRTILKDDRLGSVTWVDTTGAKTLFAGLKQALLRTFSSRVSDLQDITTHDPGKPVVNSLSFTDPSISEDHLVFLRVRERVYEVHIVPGREADLAPLLDALTSR